MRLCGIISRFQLLSPCVRQVTHALLTRPPLSHKQLQSEEICRKCFVRLACVKHAASVHPEPGSNSHKKCLSASFEQTSFNSLVSVKTYCLKGWHLIISYSMSVRKLKISKNFQGCFTVQLSMFIYQYQPKSRCWFVYFVTAVGCFCCPRSRRLDYNSTRSGICQHHFSTFFDFFLFLFPLIVKKTAGSRINSVFSLFLFPGLSAIFS